jgi:hypothetical protein
MPNLDVTDLLTDPDFVDRTLLCNRGVQLVGADGLAQNTVTAIPFQGVVTSLRGSELERTPDGERITGSILIVTRFILIDGKHGLTADVIQWRGARYTVTDVNDYSSYGRGFVQAVCELKPLSG